MQIAFGHDLVTRNAPSAACRLLTPPILHAPGDRGIRMA